MKWLHGFQKKLDEKKEVEENKRADEKEQVEEEVEGEETGREKSFIKSVNKKG